MTERSNNDVFIVVDKDGRATSRTVHAFEDCRTGAGPTKRLTPAEQSLLGVKQCVICTKRLTGGPAMDVLEGFFGEDWPDQSREKNGEPNDLAWKLLSYLKDHNFYIAQRKPKDA